MGGVAGGLYVGTFGVVRSAMGVTGLTNVLENYHSTLELISIPTNNVPIILITIGLETNIINKGQSI